MNRMTVSMALGILLDCIDYNRGACGPTEMIGAVVPRSLLKDAREALEFEQNRVFDRRNPNKLRQLPKNIKIKTSKIP